MNRKFSDLCELCLCLKVFAACVNFPIYEASRIRIFLPPRREERQESDKYYFSFFAAFASLREISRLFWLRRSRVCLCGEYFSVTCCENYRISKFGVCFSKRFDLSVAVKPFDRLRAGFWNDGTGFVCSVGRPCHGVNSKMQADTKFRDRVGSIRRICQQKI